MTTYDVESLFTNIPFNDAINICLCRHMMWSHSTSFLMMLLIFVYVDTWCGVIIQLNEAINIWWRHMMLIRYSPTSLLMTFVYDVESLFTNNPLNDAINICLCGHMMWSHYSPTSLLMMPLINVYDDIWCWVNIHQHPS